MATPSVERPPGIHEPWLGMWRFALADLKESGLWSPVLRPLLDEMIDSRRLEREHRVLAEADPVETNRESGLTHMHAGFASARAYGKRAQELATELGLTPKAKKQLARSADAFVQEADAFGLADELAQRREEKRAGSVA